MSELKLGRRDALSGSLAVVLAAAPSVRNGGGLAQSTLSHQDPELVQEGSSPSAFQKAFLAWFREEPNRFKLPVSVGAITSTRIELLIQGVHPAISTSVEDHSEINVYVEWDGVGWDQLLWLYADGTPATGGVGWIDDSVLPEFRVIHPTQEALWRENVFEDLLKWINEDLAHATHLALWGSADEVTWTRLVRNGRILKAGWTIAENGGTPTHFLQVHGYKA